MTLTHYPNVGLLIAAGAEICFEQLSALVSTAPAGQSRMATTSARYAYETVIAG